MSSFISFLENDVFGAQHPVFCVVCSSMLYHQHCHGSSGEISWIIVEHVFTLKTTDARIVIYISMPKYQTVANFFCQRHELEPTSYRWMVPILVAFFAFNELVFAIASASICCCCAPIRTTQVHTLKSRWSPLEFNLNQ